jgi:hypothetical protein
MPLLLSPSAHQERLGFDVDIRDVGSRLGAGENHELLLVRQVFWLERGSVVIGGFEGEITDGLELELGVPLPIYLKKSSERVWQIARDDVVNGASLYCRTVFSDLRDAAMCLKLLSQ